MIITVGGSIASGKTTLARLLAKRLGYAHISAGQIMRDIARERNLTIMEFSKLAENDESIDHLVDEIQKEKASKGDCVVDGRLSAYMLKADYKVFLTAPLSIRAARLNEREKKFSDIGAACDAIKLRELSEHKRYLRYYNIDDSDLSVYDMVLDNGGIDIEETVSNVQRNLPAF